MKKLISILIIFAIAILPVQAKDIIKTRVHISNEFQLAKVPETVKFKTQKKIIMPDGTIVPQRTLITAKVLKSRRELRWHKSGFFICQPISMQTELSDETIDISDKNLYIIVRKYEPVNKKEVVITSTEIVLAQAASFFAPGVDILYFFTKGAIQRKKHPNWFKAGVSNAYENSICWFWLKGKPIDLNAGDEVKIKSIDKEKVEKLSKAIEKREIREAKQREKREIRLAKREAKKAEKLARKNKKEISTGEEFYDIAENIDYATDWLLLECYFDDAEITDNSEVAVNNKQKVEKEQSELIEQDNQTTKQDEQNKK